MKILGDYFIDTGALVPVRERKSPEMPGGFTLYEVLRMIDGVPVFLEEHIKRLEKSMTLSGSASAVDLDLVKRDIIKLARANTITNSNLRVELFHNASGQLQAYHIFLSYRRYPDAKMYTTGVDAMIISAERKNPNLKILRKAMKAHAEQVVEQFQLHDVIYVNAANCITEGSRTNIFFVRDNWLYTAPGNEVLRGITRQKVLEICQNENIPVHFQGISPDEIHGFEAAFFTGTSPKVLPIRQIGKTAFNPQHPLVQRIIHLYEKLIAENISNIRRNYAKDEKG